jgi:ABC-type branched-subunit amino acid transport system substrate-binding protein
MINYTPFGHSDWQTIVADIKKFGSAGKKTAVVSTINGDANVPFYKELGNQGIKATDIPVVAFSVGEEELAGIDTKPLLGHSPPGTTSSRSRRRRTRSSSRPGRPIPRIRSARPTTRWKRTIGFDMG